MLTAAGLEAQKREWIVVSETATRGLSERLMTQLLRLASQSPSERPSDYSLRDAFYAALDAVETEDRGILLTVDEVHNAARDDLRDLAATHQHLVTEKRNVALIFAGLPSAISDLLNDDVLTFLRRATPFPLLDVPLPAVRQDFFEAIDGAGRSITDAALDEMTVATGGYPFMIQLVGYHVWRNATSDVIDIDAVNVGVPAARKRLGSTVHATALADLSAIDRTYLVAMSRDSGPSETAEIARRLEVGRNYSSVYRQRLIAAGVIKAVDYGRVDFALPYLREYLQDHAAHEELANRDTPLAPGISAA